MSSCELGFVIALCLVVSKVYYNTVVLCLFVSEFCYSTVVMCLVLREVLM